MIAMYIRNLLYEDPIQMSAFKTYIITARDSEYEIPIYNSVLTIFVRGAALDTSILTVRS